MESVCMHVQRTPTMSENVRKTVGRGRGGSEVFRTCPQKVGIFSTSLFWWPFYALKIKVSLARSILYRKIDWLKIFAFKNCYLCKMRPIQNVTDFKCYLCKMYVLYKMLPYQKCNLRNVTDPCVCVSGDRLGLRKGWRNYH